MKQKNPRKLVPLEKGRMIAALKLAHEALRNANDAFLLTGEHALLDDIAEAIAALEPWVAK